MKNNLILLAILFSSAGAALAQPPVDSDSPIVSKSFEQQAVQLGDPAGYWTEERMRSAIPRTLPAAPVADDALDGGAVQTIETPLEPPVLMPAWSPDSDAPMPTPDDGYEINLQDEDAGGLPMGFNAELQSFGSAPSNPRTGPYGPFQRWSMHGRYDVWPRFIHGKLFFTMGGSNFVCSGTVVGRNVVATAGHCVSSGGGQFGSNFMFCPGYSQSGPMPGTGCWAVRNAFTTGRWHNGGDFDYDYACMVTASTGTQFAGPIANRTGSAGIAFNWASEQPIVQFGYPAGRPFTGDIIEQVASTEWYEVDMGTGGQRSKYIGSDLTGGSSGGGWFLSWRHPNAELPDTDGFNSTDPAGARNGPFLNGVNSHRRCRTNCNEPPTNTAGMFWQEMGSPVFRSSTTDDQDASDVFTACFDAQ
ncbi:MAG: hypothetical protein K9L70_00315 [Thiohalocapsa sp.]|nr:hypothetical protein [Thiohalocapsa sp.]MCF7991340.1 hypothetical protein [Thiohalocapsa sp.]